jgi:protein-tyrosine phosphatase
MDVNYTGERTEETIEDIVGSEPPKLRLQPTIYDRRTNTYKAWRNVSWTLDCADIEEAKRLRDALQVFFQQVADHGVEPVLEALTVAAIHERDRHV